MNDPLCKGCELTPEQANELRRGRQILNAVYLDIERMKRCGTDCRAQQATADVVASKIDRLLAEFAASYSGEVPNPSKPSNRPQPQIGGKRR